MRDPMIGSGLILRLAAIVVVSGLAPLVIGILLDRLLQTSPCITLLLLALSVSLGTIAVIRQVSAAYVHIAGGKK